jgi:hypothetical protein
VEAQCTTCPSGQGYAGPSTYDTWVTINGNSCEVKLCYCCEPFGEGGGKYYVESMQIVNQSCFPASDDPTAFNLALLNLLAADPCDDIPLCLPGQIIPIVYAFYLPCWHRQYLGIWGLWFFMPCSSSDSQCWVEYNDCNGVLSLIGSGGSGSCSGGPDDGCFSLCR